MLLAMRPVEAYIRAVADGGAFAGSRVIAGLGESVPGACRRGIESDRLDSYGIHQTDGDTIAGECVANKTRAARVRARGKGVEDCGQRAVRIASLRKIARTLQIRWHGTDRG